ncbi:Short-chain dehydrogenase/reductase SDR OS=Tsukamurella paurometabola (strain ATCC 8368 / DSM/ CCUG 35730 / CIP 100753 / JCM 10117 / KCTC 9821 / NBRC 16120/ NCIMB 702349 / NCTC 13040) OX=521096 GN=Tpau_0851 PE=3 SV=1 [Tsukamurella paurometabola]|uniref:Short-chain dehydrogenase/reductase SDR n=1 Tax=Tsukamurella paurometabola (strain ATCC 8368 / DSM 20162 / CCUG 35730 / CIP 100753 / JCM 10117 / KCTC 9821 / NBRC 16120 / NCIMB 702349 / NCTC 13040) TaxID=521096 RepID=D5UTY2_TSUPD|nr:SDR family NAD(P)-dependent oxidoreductase [Tsukamurella paurometabola]ADG77486.1 short-chain dehydrogenase/reductase SDR [Tsukamurella paurometabola DSM 20162]SUP27359.1 Fatty acyl-CoA reductase [Tsukamurella paurometabola]
MAVKWTERDVPDQRGRVAVVTGANTGLGFETARVLAQHGAEVVLAVRDTAKGDEAARRIAAVAPAASVRVQRLDLASLESVRSAAAELRATTPRIDLLINNAGVIPPARQCTADGFELQFGTMHLGHFAWTAQVLDLLLGVPGSRVVTVSSDSHRYRTAVDFDDLQWERSYPKVAAYTQAKLANLLFHYALQRRLAARAGGTVALAAHPGVADTDAGRHMHPLLQRLIKAARPLYQDAASGALPQLRAATDPAALGGQFYGPDGRGERRGHPRVTVSSEYSYDLAAQHQLWAVSEELTGITFPV